MRLYVSLFLVGLFSNAPMEAGQSLRLSVYATAGGIHRYLGTEAERRKVMVALRRLGISRIFLEGRRGEEYVSPEQLRELAEFFRREGIEASGGIATVPGRSFGVRQNGGLSWLNFQAEQTQRDIAAFFRDNAPVFEELIVDDFYCTADTSPESEKARAGRNWPEYRQQLLASLVEPMMLTPARAARPGVRVIIKYPQWYDRFHLFGYSPERLSPAFDAVWVGTEVRNPETRRMGYVQPTEGYVNFRWLRAVAGAKVRGAWFDHIECTARNFLDQAYQSVLAGAGELTLFHLGDIVEGHPGDALLAQSLPELRALAAKLVGREPQGVAFYKPAGSDGEENTYLMDYLGMLGIPLVPAAQYPGRARVAVLAAQAAADPELQLRIGRHLAAGARLFLTPALLRRVPALGEAAGVAVSRRVEPGLAREARIGTRLLTLATPLEVDMGLKADKAAILLSVRADGRWVPLLTRRGTVYVWNVRTFAEQDFHQVGEWLLAPKPLGLVRMPHALVNALRGHILAPLGVSLQAPARVAFCDFEGFRCLYNFTDAKVTARLNGKSVELEANRLWCNEPL